MEENTAKAERRKEQSGDVAEKKKMFEKTGEQ